MKGVLMKHYESEAAKCPFYHGEDKQKILCEGVEVGITTHVAFSSPVLARNYKDRFCHNPNMKYRCCGYYLMLSSKY